MTTDGEPRRPWWKRKRCWAAAVVWSYALYELSFGPAIYCYRRGWIPGRIVITVWRQTIPDSVGEAIGLWDYNRWWDDLGRRHRQWAKANR